jgi:hypothetical protein
MPTWLLPLEISSDEEAETVAEAPTVKLYCISSFSTVNGQARETSTCIHKPVILTEVFLFLLQPS